MYSGLLICILLLSSETLANYVINVEDVVPKPAEDEGLFDVEGLLTSYGYPFENHEVTTEDGYILGVHRIPHGKDESQNKDEGETKPAVLIMHGMHENSVDFFILSPERSLALLLVDAGYDVWLGNNRGNTWSKKHTSLDPKTDEVFWDFSFHELGVYDDTAIIDYILSTTKNEQVSYIGHSRGTTQFFSMLTMRPEYNEKITVMAALAPVVYMDHMANPIFQFLKDFYDTVLSISDSLHLTEVLPYSASLAATLQDFCSDDSDTQEICSLVIFIICGFDTDQLDRGIFSKMFQTLPAGTSWKEHLHYLQEIKSGHFRPFDYGEEKNLEIYEGAEPPDYNIANVVAPVALYYAENDWLAATSDVDRLAEELPNVAVKKLIDFPAFNHLDFLFGKDAASLVYGDVIDLINLYNGDNSFTRPTVPITSSTTSSITSTPTTENTTPSKPTTPDAASSLFNSIHVLSTIFLLIVVTLLV